MSKARQIKPNLNQDSNTRKDPQNWKTGDEPMTGAQRSYLKTLADEAGEELDAELTKAEASEKIDQLRSDDRVIEHRKDDDPDASNTRKDPEQWTTGEEPMTGAQKSYLQTLCEEAGVEFDDTLTKAAASKRIDELRSKNPRTQ
jgi:hypothetical protein